MSYFSSRNVKSARKSRICDHCSATIAVGEPYRYLAFDCEGEFCDAHVHHECHEFCLAYTDTEEGWCCLRDIEPGDEYEFAESIVENPPSEAMLARVPAKWAAAARAALQGAGQVEPAEGDHR